jgi:ribosomal protein S18 acetylase RimI-like enzyme
VQDAVLRRLIPEDLDFLIEMFLETVSWRDGSPRRSLDEILGEPDLARYVVDWGRDGDAGLVAVLPTGEHLGAAWYRYFTAADPGYGFVAPDVPELGIAVRSEHRGRGIGRTLMLGLLRLATNEGCRAMSLSVEEENRRALGLYEELAFKRVQRVGGSWTMLRSLDPAISAPC